MHRTLVCLTLLGLSAFPGTSAKAQYRPAPTQYTIVNATSASTQRFYRDGDRVLVDLVMPRSKAQPDGMHLRTIVDAPTTTSLTWDLRKPSTPCNSTFKGSWGDPFGLWSQMALDDSIAPKKAGTDTVNGMATTKYVKTTPEANLEFWRENKYGLLVKAVMTLPGRKPVEMFETKEFKVGAPDASTFTVPARCGWKKPGSR